MALSEETRRSERERLNARGVIRVEEVQRFEVRESERRAVKAQTMTRYRDIRAQRFAPI